MQTQIQPLPTPMNRTDMLSSTLAHEQGHHSALTESSRGARQILSNVSYEKGPEKDSKMKIIQDYITLVDQMQLDSSRTIEMLRSEIQGVPQTQGKPEPATSSCSTPQETNPMSLADRIGDVDSPIAQQLPIFDDSKGSYYRIRITNGSYVDFYLGTKIPGARTNMKFPSDFVEWCQVINTFCITHGFDNITSYVN